MARPQVLDLAVAQALDLESERRQALCKQVLAARIRRRHRWTADQSLGECNGIYQVRNSSLIEVLARVFSSTRFTITAQYKDGPLPEGREPDTTTE